MIFLSAMLLFLIALVQLSAASYTVSTDFDLIADIPGSNHSIRVYALATGITTVEIISIAPFTGAPDITATLADTGDSGEWELPAGSIINADQPVLVIKYDAAGLSLESSLAGNDTAFMVDSGDFFIVAASADTTAVSVDLDNDGIPEEYNIDSGYALIGTVGAGKSVTSSNAVIGLALDTGTPDLTGVYLLIPGSSAYAPLAPITVPAAEDDMS